MPMFYKSPGRALWKKVVHYEKNGTNFNTFA